jgi:radical SAM-linked protein
MEPLKQQFRITYKKGQELRYTANLDVHKIWERFFRRARIPLAYSKGFHPQPRINQALPLPLGMLSEKELLDFWTEVEDAPLQLREVDEKIKSIHHPGIEIVSMEEIVTKQKSLQSQVKSVKYKANQFYKNDFNETLITVEDLLSETRIIRSRRKKDYDLRPMILSLSADVNENSGFCQYMIHLTALPGMSGRPDEVVAALGHDPNHFRITRTDIILEE